MDEYIDVATVYHKESPVTNYFCEEIDGNRLSKCVHSGHGSSSNDFLCYFMCSMYCMYVMIQTKSDTLSGGYGAHFSSMWSGAQSPFCLQSMSLWLFLICVGGTR